MIMIIMIIVLIYQMNLKIYNNNINRKKNKLKKVNYDNQILNKNFTSLNNNLDIDSFGSNNYEIDNNNDIFHLKEKIKELTEEINNKNLLINEYSTLARKSKIKFEELIIHNKKKIEEIKKENKKQNMLYKSKIIEIEKERKNILNKYLENKKYTDFLETLLFTSKNVENISNLNNINNSGENKKIKNMEEILKKLLNHLSIMKNELENKRKDNEKLKKIIIKYKNSKTYRAISNPRRNNDIFE